MKNEKEFEKLSKDRRHFLKKLLRTTLSASAAVYAMAIVAGQRRESAIAEQKQDQNDGEVEVSR